MIFPLLDRFEVIISRLTTPPTPIEQVHELSPTVTSEAAVAKWPKLVNYLHRMRQLPFVASQREPTQMLARFADTYRQNAPDPDIR